MGSVPDPEIMSTGTRRVIDYFRLNMTVYITGIGWLSLTFPRMFSLAVIK